MSLINSTAIPSSGGYEIDQSLRFNDNDSAYLSRTPASASNQKTWTWSAWVKRGNLGVVNYVFHAYSGNSDDGFFRIEFNGASDQIRVRGWGTTYLQTNAVYRDTSAWYHIVLVADTSQSQGSATESDSRIRLYVNGEQVTSFASSNMRSQNFITPVNSNTQHNLSGKNGYSTGDYIDGYLAEVNFIDGQALTASSFGETGDYGEWKPIAYSGTYGTNGFYLDFSNSGALGTDSSGNSNTWTPNNLAATDQMLDSPTNNFATMNPLDKASGTAIYSEGNLKVSVGDNEETFGSFGIEKGVGKYYFEMCHISSAGSNNKIGVGIGSAGVTANDEVVDYGHSGTTWGVGTIIGVAVNSTAEEVSFYKNNVIIGSAVDFSGKSWSYWKPIVTSANSAGEEVVTLNFGQDSSFAGAKTAQGNQDGNDIGDFYYAPPTGFLALCTSNLPDVAVVPSEHFNTVLYSGTGSSNAITGVGFQPDWLWVKRRSAAASSFLFDSVRGASKRLRSDTTEAESSGTPLTSFDSDGFTLGDSSGNSNASGSTYAAWNWKANGSGSSNTNGSITSTVSANVDAGFSIVSYTGTGAAATVGHGLTVAPELIIHKSRDDVTDWYTQHKDLANAVDYLRINNTGQAATASTLWDNYPTATVFDVKTNAGVNGSAKKLIAYAFHSVDGYSKVGSYTGNGSADGTFVYTGFRPAYVMVKRTDSAGDWLILDTDRSPYNVEQARLKPNTSAGEVSGDGYDYIDGLSNGFKLRGVAGSNGSNGSGATYIFLAFAESPFKYSNAR